MFHTMIVKYNYNYCEHIIIQCFNKMNTQELKIWKEDTCISKVNLENINSGILSADEFNDNFNK